MTSRFYDVVIVGERLGALAAATLLARRDFRVLLLGQGERPATYFFEGLPLRRRTFDPTFGSSPVFRRILAELAQTLGHKRRQRRLDPMFHWFSGHGPTLGGGPGSRRWRARTIVEFPPDPELFAREAGRVWAPAARASVEAYYGELARLNGAMDEALAQDAMWPPSGFWERRQTNRLASLIPSHAPTPSPEVRALVDMTARYSSRLFERHPVLTARLHGAWVRGVHGIVGDEDGLRQGLIERLQAHGGEVRRAERSEGILHRNNQVTHALVEGEPVSCPFFLGDLSQRALCDEVREIDPRAESGVAKAPTVAARRFVVSLVVSTALVPESLAEISFLEGQEGGPSLVLQRASVSHHRASEAALMSLDAELWVAEFVQSAPAPGSPDWSRSLSGDGIQNDRSRVLATLRGHFPCLDQHLLVVDSPHDGLPLWDYRSGSETKVGRAHLRLGGGNVEIESAELIYHAAPAPYAPFLLEDVRTPIDGLLCVAPTVAPGLGLEGELLSAWGAARIVTKSDPQKEKMRREMWSKIEV